MSEESRRRLTTCLAVSGWTIAATITTLRTFGVVPANIGSVAVLAIGVAIASSLSLSRMRLAKTITQVFIVGMRAQRDHFDAGVIEDGQRAREREQD